MLEPGLIVLAPLFALFLGILVGSGLTTRIQDKRARQQAAMQRDLNLQFHLLREQQEVAENDLRWPSKQRTGIQVIAYEVTN